LLQGDSFGENISRERATIRIFFYCKSKVSCDAGGSVPGGDSISPMIALMINSLDYVS